MFVRVSTLILAIAASAIASHGGATASTVNQCNNGELQCCNSVMNASEAPSDIIDVLRLDPNSNTPIGLYCSPDSQCSAQTVCCDNTQAVGDRVVGIDCSPVNVNA